MFLDPGRARAVTGDGYEAGPLHSLPLLVGVHNVHGGVLPLLTEAAIGCPGVHHPIQVEACPLQLDLKPVS